MFEMTASICPLRPDFVSLLICISPQVGLLRPQCRQKAALVKAVSCSQLANYTSAKKYYTKTATNMTTHYLNRESFLLHKICACTHSYLFRLQAKYVRSTFG